MTSRQWAPSSAMQSLSDTVSIGPRATEEEHPPALEGTEKARIVVGTADARELRSLCFWLASSGYEANGAQNGQAVWQLIQKHCPTLVILDETLPGTDSWALCRRVRETFDIMVMLLSTKDKKADRIRAYMCGSDDYLVKPFDIEELLLRSRVLLRRAVGEPLAATVDLDGGRVQVHLDRHSVTADGRMVDLTSTEYRLLACLVERRGAVASHQEMLDAAWGGQCAAQNESYQAGRNEIKVYVSYLRRKLGDDAREPRIIQTVPTVGYRLAVGIE